MKHNFSKLKGKHGTTLMLADYPDGPIISGRTEKEAILKMNDALKLWQFLKWVITFRNTKQG